ncbi:hypothetical protein [Actinomyces minihominis]|uniref:hypothetical protein n=1 Tax=Actinomyces minihominis TaxID=2002838 RepID=UPI000C08256F|nr:hypothetical protein [Actinomyces minihominis]
MNDKLDASEAEMSSHNINTFTWIAPNPFGEDTPFLLLTPGDRAAQTELQAASEQLGLESMGFGGDIPWVGTDHLAVALRGPLADLYAADRTWIKVPVIDAWTGNAIARRYIVLAAGEAITGPDMSADELSAYLKSDVHAGLVKIRLRVTDN